MKKNVMQNTLYMCLGAFLIAGATVVFFTPNKIVCGGISGISTLLYYAGEIPLGLSYGVINGILLLLGAKVLGKRFILKTIIGTGLLSLFMELMEFIPPVTDNAVIASIFGGMLYGIGLGIIFVARASTGGTDILGRLLQKKSPDISIGNALAIIDGIIIAISVIVFKNTELVLLGILGLFIQSLTIDFVIGKFNSADMIFVVTHREEKVKRHIRSKYNRGVTELDAYGFANVEKGKKLLICLMKPKETADFRKTIEEVDPEAFIMFSEAKTIIGNGFKYYN